MLKVDGGLKELHLPIMREKYRSLAEKATSEAARYEEYLFWLIEQEQEGRRVKRIERRLEESKLPLQKTMTSFDLKRFSSKLACRINGLLSGDFIQQKENLLVFGSPGSGKTHLLAAIGQELICRHDMKVYFTSTHRMVQELLLAKRDLHLPKMLKKWTSYDALIIDDIGYVQQTREEMEVLFALISEFYERSSLLISSNLPFSKWEQIFKDPMMAMAAIDRLVHHSVILEINVPSYRMEGSKEKKNI
jgi:DNA replication protein DnaC